MLYAKKAPKGASFTVARCLNDSLPGLLVLFLWEKWVSFFSVSDAWCEKTKLGRYSDKAYLILLFLTNFIYFWFGPESETDFDIVGVPLISAVACAVLFEACRLSSPGYVLPLASDAATKLPYCDICRVHKLQRSVHDKHTDRCLQRFDHYNHWMRAPIASHNYRLYVLYKAAQLINSYTLWGHLGSVVSVQWAGMPSTSVAWALASLAWLVTAFLCCCFVHLFARTAYHVFANITTYEVANYTKLDYVTFEPNYFNLFDRKWTENIIHLFTAYRDEKDSWETVFTAPSSGANPDNLLGAILQSQVHQAPMNIPTEQQMSDDALIKQWLTGGV